MEVAKVSVIIPVYNAEKYIKECLDSIIKQTFQDIQVVIVDDGSVDKSSEIIENYLKKDRRIEFYKKKNGGQSSARNLGLKYSLGKYILFVDSDDFLDLHAIEKLFYQAEANGADIVYFDAEVIFEDINDYDKKKVEYYYRKIKYPTNSGKQMLCEMIHDDCFTDSACLMLLKKDFLHKNGLSFIEGMYYEDCLFSTTAMLKAEKVYHLNEKLYFYNIHNNSTMTKTPDKAEYLYGRCQCFYHFLKLLYEEELSAFQYDSIGRFISIARNNVQNLAKVVPPEEIARFINFPDIGKLSVVLILCDCNYIAELNVLQHFLNKEKNVLIWGCGAYSKRLYTFLKLIKKDESIKGFVDINYKCDMFFDKPVFTKGILSEKMYSVIISFKGSDAVQCERECISMGLKTLRVDEVMNLGISNLIKKELKI